jgi:predicted Zn-dependent peptidase
MYCTMNVIWRGIAVIIDRIPYLNEEVYKEKLSNGLSLCFYPRKQDNRVFGALSVKCGSIHLATSRSHGTSCLPAGTAHFLEHILLETSGVLDEFSASGALVNGHTTFDRTTYTFSGIGNVTSNINSLFHILNVSNITEQSLELQQKIISQELRARNSDPAWSGIFNMLQALYEHHPVQYPIGGSEESVYAVTRKMLVECYSHYYRPQNMLLVLVGDFDPYEARNSLNSLCLNAPHDVDHIQGRISPREGRDVRQAVTHTYMSVQTPSLYIGWKESVETDVMTTGSLMQHALLKALVLDYLFGQSSVLYHDLMNNGLVESGMNWDYYTGHSYGFSYIEVVTNNLEKAERYIRAYLLQASSSQVDEDLYDSLKRKAIGRYLSSFDSAMTLSTNIVEWAHKDCDYFQTIDLLQAFSLQTFQTYLKALLESDAMAVCRIFPRDHQMQAN